VADASDAAFDAAVAEAMRVFAGEPKPVHPGEELAPGAQFHQLRVEGQTEMRFLVRAAKPGRYALFTQHFADEFQTVFMAAGQKIFPRAMRNFRDRFGQIVIQPTAVRAFGVKLEPAALRTLTPSFTAPARVAYNAEAIAHVGSPLPGRVVELRARLGDVVSKGEVLLVVESPELGEAQSDYLQKQILAKTAVATVDLAKNGLDRATRLYEQNKGIALDEVQKREVEYKAAQAAVRTAEAAAMAAENKLHMLGMDQSSAEALRDSGEVNPRFSIVAPLAGRVVEREVTLGHLVSPDKEALIVLADTTRLWVLVDVPEMRLNDVAVGSTARITVPALPSSSFEGVVSLISAELNEATRTAQIRVEVDNADERLRPGMFAQAEITGPASVRQGGAGVLAVPESAVQTIEGKPVVFVPFPEKANTFLKRPVTLGEAVGGMFPVLYGLREGETIVVAATFILKAELGKSTAKHEH
jgi:cobalt-zinc-cadmium efflux system membrane fusion protein